MSDGGSAVPVRRRALILEAPSDRFCALSHVLSICRPAPLTSLDTSITSSRATRPPWWTLTEVCTPFRTD
eukprot:3991275-Prymnesium_polylepis.1